MQCDWLVERALVPPADLPREFLEEWYDMAADCGGVEVVECGAPVHDIVDGWECEAGHRHLFYGSPSQIAEERCEAMMERLGFE